MPSHELIPFAPKSVGSDVVQMVNGQDIYAFLGITKDYSSWVKAQIKRAHLVENRDYIIFTQKGDNSQRGRPAIEYHFTFNAATHIALISSAKKGHEVREYFIACEKQLQALQATSPGMEYIEREMAAYRRIGESFGTPLHIVHQEAVKYIEETTGVNLRPMLAAGTSQDNIPLDEQMLEPTDLAHVVGLGEHGGAWMNRFLQKIGWQQRLAGKAWECTPEGTPHCALHAWTKNGKSGYNLKWRVGAVRAALQNAGMID